METSLIGFISMAFKDGGVWMWAILVAQIFAVAIVIERVMQLYVLRKRGQKQLAQAIELDIRQGKLDVALARARSMGGANAISRVSQAGIMAAMDLGGREEIQARMDEALLDEKIQMEKRTGFLAMLGNVGTLLGLLGTIVGLIQSFSSVGSLNPTEKAAMLTQGVSLAMNTTAYGLIMAIPALVMYAVLQGRTTSLMDDLNQGALRVYNSLGFGIDSAEGTQAAK